MTDVLTINNQSGNGIFNFVCVREKFNINALNTIHKITITESAIIGGSGLNAVSVKSPEVSTEDIERAQYAYTEKDTVVVIPPLGVSDGWDVTSVMICGCPGSGSLQSVNPTTGEITYTPLGGFTGSDIYRYTIIDSVGTLRNVYQFVIVVDPVMMGFANNFAVIFNGTYASMSDADDIPGNYIVDGTNPTDITSGVIVTATWDPSGYFSGPLQGPLDYTTIPGLVLGFNASGDLTITVPGGTGYGPATLITGTYKFQDTFGNDTTVGNFSMNLAF